MADLVRTAARRGGPTLWLWVITGAKPKEWPLHMSIVRAVYGY